MPRAPRRALREREREPALRCAPGCARPSAARAPGAGAGEERAPPPRAPRPPPPPSPPLALPPPPRPLAERRKPAGSRWPGAPGSGRAAGKHRAVFLSSSAGVAGEVGVRRNPSPSAGLASIPARGGSAGQGPSRAGGEPVEPGTLGGPASLEKSPRKDVCGGDQTCLSSREPQLPPCRSNERVDEAHFALLCTSEGFKWARFHKKRTEKFQRRKRK